MRMNKAATISVLTAIIMVLSFVIGCGVIPPLRTTSGEASATIGSAGGTIEVSDRSNPLCGVAVSIPEGALRQELLIRVDVAQQELSVPDGFIKAGKGIQLGPEGTVFQLPVTITVPYVDDGIDENTLCVYEYEPEGPSRVVPIKAMDTDQNRVCVETFSFSAFFPLAADGEQLPAQSPPIVFDPKFDGLSSLNASLDNVTRGVCYGEVSFVQWFWGNKKSTDGALMKWNTDQHLRIANMAFCTTLEGNSFDPLDVLKLKIPTECEKLMRSLASGKPQMAGLYYDSATDNVTRKLVGHAILVYGYTTTDTVPQNVVFSVYDPNCALKESYMTYDGMFLKSPYYDIRRLEFLGECSNTRALEFVYEYFKTPPEITAPTPTGVIEVPRPAISAVIHYPFIDEELTSMKLDDNVVAAGFERIDEHDARVSFTPGKDLSPGLHTVYVSGSSYVSQSRPGEKGCAPAEDKTWTFLIAGGETWSLTLRPHLPAWHMAGRCVEINYIAEDYDAPAGEADLDLEQMGPPAWVEQAWASATTGEAVVIAVTRDGNDISGSFEFTHQPSGCTITADLVGTIVGDKVSFKINYHVPPDLQDYSMPWGYSDEMSELDGTVYYSIPAELTVSYEGTMTQGAKENTIEGSFTVAIGGQCALWRFHEKEYSYGIGYGREELLFDGITELTFSDVRLHGDFAVSVDSGIVV